MNQDVGDSLNRLELKNGVEGVRRLSLSKRLSKVFPDPQEDEYLHIVVERPGVGAFHWIIVIFHCVLMVRHIATLPYAIPAESCSPEI